jgi:hypothetical protein
LLVLVSALDLHGATVDRIGLVAASPHDDGRAPEIGGAAVSAETGT